MLAGSALAIASPANAQSSFGFHFGNGAYGGSYYGNQGYRDYGQSRGFWRWDPYLHRQIWIASQDFDRGHGFDRRGRDHDDYRGWDHGYRGR